MLYNYIIIYVIYYYIIIINNNKYKCKFDSALTNRYVKLLQTYK